MAEPLLRSDAPSIVIGIGASAGGVEALRAALTEVPKDLDAAVFVVLHLPAAPPARRRTLPRCSSPS